MVPVRYRPALILLVCLVACGVAAAALITTFFTARAEMRRQLETLVKVMAQDAAAKVDADLCLKAYELRSFESSEYRQVERALRSQRDEWRRLGLEVSFLYTLVPSARAQSGLVYAVDAEEDPKDKSPADEPWKPTEGNVAAFDPSSVTSLEYTDRYGTFFSGFAPVKGADGRVRCVLGVDLDGRVVNDAAWGIVGSALLPTAVLAILAVLAAGTMGERLVRPLAQLRAFAERIGRGDLTAQAPSLAPGEVGEIGRAFNQTAATLRSTVRNADQTSMRVADACERLLETAGPRARAANLAAERTADGARRARTMSDLATSMARETRSAEGAAREAIEASAETIAGIGAIDAGVRALIDRGQELATTLRTMRERAATVDSALEAMVQVANRSSVLSLNAEIEANQAGPAGRGFAVVAREIRRLAEQAAANSMQIEQNVARLHEALDRGARATDEFGTAAETAGAQAANLLACLASTQRKLEGLLPVLRTATDRSETFRDEGSAVHAGLADAERAARELHQFLGSFEETLVELRDRSGEVRGLLASMRTE